MTNQWSHIRLKAVIRRFGLRNFQLKPYASFYRANAAFRVLTDQGKWLLKPYNRKSTVISDKQQIKAVVDCMRKLEQEQYAHIPRWRTTQSGRYWVMQNKKAYYVTEWIEGRRLSMESSDFEALGRALASLHHIRVGFHGRTRSPTRKQLKLLQADDRRFRKQLAILRTNNTQAGKWFAFHHAECNALSNQAWEELLNKPETGQILAVEAEHPSYIHGDVTLPNVIVAADGIKLIDWDNVRIGSVYFEIAKTLANVTGFNLELMRALLRGYEEIRELRKGERLLIAGLFRFPREAWFSAKALAHGRQHPVLRIMQRSWVARLHAVQGMDEWATGVLMDYSFR